MSSSGTTRKKTTLADLDRRVCAEGGGRGALPRHAASAAALGADVLAQIDLLRGRGEHTRKRGIAALIAPHNPPPPRALSVSRAYDTGHAIHASGGYERALALPVAPRSTWHSMLETADDWNPAAFAVEVFEDETSDRRASQEPAPAPEPPVAGPARHVAPTGSGDPATAPAAPPSSAPPPVSQPIEVPVAAALSSGQREDGILGLDLSGAAASDREDAEQFEREIQAILSGRTTRPQPAPPAAPVPSAPAATAPVIATAVTPHGIFEEMGQNMAYATAFHLPPMELGKRLDQFEREIAAEEAVEGRAPAAEMSLDLSDEDLARGLLPAPVVPYVPASAPPVVPYVPAPAPPAAQVPPAVVTAAPVATADLVTVAAPVAVAAPAIAPLFGPSAADAAARQKPLQGSQPAYTGRSKP